MAATILARSLRTAAFSLVMPLAFGLALAGSAWAQVRVLVTDQASLSLSTNIAVPGRAAYNDAGDYVRLQRVEHPALDAERHGHLSDPGRGAEQRVRGRL